MEVITLKKYKEILVKLKKTGFFSIVISSVFSKVIVFLGGILIVRLLSQDDYANYTLIINAFSILSILGDWGASSATLQFMSEENNNKEKAEVFLKFGVKITILSAIISGILIFCSKLYYPFKNETVANLTTLLFLVPILTFTINLISNILRAKKENHKFSLFQVLSIIIHYLVIIPLTLLFGLFGSIISQYIYNILILILGIFIVKKVVSKSNDTGKVSKSEKKSFLKFAMGSQINNSISNLLYTIDIFTIGLLVANSSDLAIYKVSTIIPSALSFLPYCFIIYIFPYFVEHNKNKSWLSSKLKDIIKYGAFIYGIISILLMFSSYYLILWLYGPEYLGAVLPFNILIIGFFFMATVTIPTLHVIHSMRKVKVNILINIISIVLNFVFNIIFISLWGIIGAAVATALVKFIMSIISLLYARKYLKND